MKEKLNNPKMPGRRLNLAVITKAIVSAGFTLLTVIFAVGVSIFSFGWFSSNDTTEGNGISVAASGSLTLIISDDRDVVLHPGADPSLLLRKTFVSDSDVALEPATHNNGDVNTDIPLHGLKVVENENIISPVNGLTENDTTTEIFTFKPATENVHYVDFTVYIGIFGLDLDYTALTLSLDEENCFAQCEKGFTPAEGVTYYTRSNASFTAATPTDTENTVYYTNVFDGVYRTVCADVFYNDIYRGTLCPASETKSVVLNSAPGTLTASEPQKVTIRLYFDGNMKDEDGKAILRANNQKLNRVFLSFDYDAG